MSTTTICVWAPTANRFDAFAAAVSALAHARASCRFHRATLHTGSGVRDCTIAEAVSAARDLYGTGAAIRLDVGATLNTGRLVPVEVEVLDEPYARVFESYEPFMADVREPASIHEVDELFGRICVSPHVVTGARSIAREWPAPAEVSATYNADGRVARDLALTWIHLRERRRVRDVAGLSLNALHARVEASAPGASVGVATSLAAWIEHERAGWGTDRTGRRLLPDDAVLTREQVLAALATAPTTLLDALEACAVPSNEERPREPFELDTMPDPEDAVATHEHPQAHAVEQHARYQVSRLANGGVIMATHPNRVLWPLWADAISLLGMTNSPPER